MGCHIQLLAKSSPINVLTTLLIIQSLYASFSISLVLLLYLPLFISFYFYFV